MINRQFIPNITHRIELKIPNIHVEHHTYRSLRNSEVIRNDYQGLFYV